MNLENSIFDQNYIYLILLLKTLHFCLYDALQLDLEIAKNNISPLKPVFLLIFVENSRTK